jgi:prepilin-type N-terminal cleavage/methylation domain-containing protein
MRTIRRLIEAKKAQREENGEAGFSLIELIIVIVILGILVAVAFPIIGGIQAAAEKSAANAAASNLATEIAADIAETGTWTAVTTYQGYTVDGPTADVSDLASVCVTVSKTSPAVTSDSQGPGC